MVRPLIQETVKSAVEGMRSTVVADMIKSNKTLQETVKEQSRIIKEQKSVIEDQKIMLDSNSETIEQLQCTVHVLEGEIDELKLTHNELEQYGRRNSLRINNMIFRGPRGPPQDERSLTLSVLDFLNSEGLVERTGAVLKPRTLGREVPGSSPPVAVRCGLEQVTYPQLLR